MNFPIAVLLLCALIGLADKMIGGRFGLAEEFDRGMTMMGSLTVTMSGVYCFSVMLGRLLSTVLQGVSLPLDPTILVSSVLLIWVLIPLQIPSAPIIHKKSFLVFCFPLHWELPSLFLFQLLWEVFPPKIPRI